jgi:hypothetical protein
MMQKYVTKSQPQSETPFEARWQNVIKHCNIFTKLSNKPIEEANCYEFGAGWDLMFPLSFSALEFSNIYCVDIHPLVVISLTNHTIDSIDKRLRLPDRVNVKIRG